MITIHPEGDINVGNTFSRKFNSWQRRDVTECVSTPPSWMMTNVNKFEHLRRSFKVIHIQLDNRHRLIHLFIHLLFRVVLILSIDGGLPRRPTKQGFGCSGSCLFCLMFIKKCRLCVICHLCLTSIHTFPQPALPCRGVWEITFALECNNSEKSIFFFFLSCSCIPSFANLTVLRPYFEKQKNVFSRIFAGTFLSPG